MGRVINRFGVLSATCALSLLAIVTPQAAADSGDRTLWIDSHGADLATNQCPGASFQVVVKGAPGAADDYGVYLSSGYDSCVARAKMVYATAGGNVGSTNYRYSHGNSSNAILVEDVYRCYVAVGVRRDNGTFYTRNLIPDNQESANCPE